jgi:AcrR family transcriptional regulator
VVISRSNGDSDGDCVAVAACGVKLRGRERSRLGPRLSRLTDLVQGCCDATVPVEPSTKERIVLTAERLFAEHGVAGVSLRQIAAACGSGNNSVVQYHFGSKESLVQAVFEHRLPRLNARRARLIADRRPDDLRGWIGVQLRAVLEQSEIEGSHYMGFVTGLSRLAQNPLDLAPPGLREPPLEIQAQLRRRVDHLPEPLATHRLNQAMTVMTTAAAWRERALAEGRPVLPFDVELADLLDSTVAFLEAPASTEALAAVEAAALDGTPQPIFL